MNFQSATDPRMAETIFRTVQNAYTATQTITSASIAINSPIIMETATASLPSTVATFGQNWIRRPATSTSIVNNLFAGLLARVPSANPTYLDREQIGLAQVYGAFRGAAIQVLTTTSLVGQVMIPESLQFLVAVGGPVTAAATATAGHVETPAIGGLAILMEQIASSAATDVGTASVFLRCM